VLPSQSRLALTVGQRKRESQPFGSVPDASVARARLTSRFSSVMITLTQAACALAPGGVPPIAPPSLFSPNTLHVVFALDLFSVKPSCGPPSFCRRWHCGRDDLGRSLSVSAAIRASGTNASHIWNRRSIPTPPSVAHPPGVIGSQLPFLPSSPSPRTSSRPTSWSLGAQRARRPSTWRDQRHTAMATLRSAIAKLRRIACRHTWFPVTGADLPVQPAVTCLPTGVHARSSGDQCPRNRHHVEADVAGANAPPARAGTGPRPIPPKGRRGAEP